MEDVQELQYTPRRQNLFFTTAVDAAIQDADLIFISVNTPTKTQGFGSGMASDLSYVESAARSIAKHATKNSIIVEKSTVPCKTADTIREIVGMPSSYSQSAADRDLSSLKSMPIRSFYLTCCLIQSSLLRVLLFRTCYIPTVS